MKHIFHTSFCGSTYLAVLLSKSITTFCEPECSYDLKGVNELSKQGEFLLKFPSSLCFFAPILLDKKIFLYRKLKNQLQKFKKNSKLFSEQQQSNYLKMKNNLHNKTKIFNFGDNYLLNNAYLWADRFNWLLDSTDVMYIETNDLLINIHKKIKLICEFFELKYVPIDVNFHVKEHNLNNNNEAINIDQIKEYNLYNPLTGVEEYVLDEEIEDISYIIKKSYPYLESYI
jgi:hypothetical protein